MNKKLILEPFCFRQFDTLNKSSSHIHCTKEELLDIANQQYDPTKLMDGYAPFCKHIFLKNFTNTPCSAVQITPENEHFIRTTYEARTPKEVNFFHFKLFSFIKVTSFKEIFPLRQSTGAQSRIFECKMNQSRPIIQLILYSREQILKENQAMGNEPLEGEYEYGIVAIKPQMVDYIIPMDPITMMRNSLGIDEGGSGIKIDRDKYMESVNYWKDHALVQ